MQIVISGSSGLVGRALCKELPRYKHEITRLLRYQASEQAQHDAALALDASDAVAAWDPDSGLLDPGVLAGQDAVLCLNGSSITGKKWDKTYKQELLDSRTRPTRLLAETIARLPQEQRPGCFIACSAIGFYGTRPLSVLQDENAPSGEGYLAEICRQWEAAAQPAIDAGVRVVLMRLGIVLASDGGPLSAIVGAFNKGLGGVVGDGKQMMSWICIHDIAPAIHHLLTTDSLRGPVNFSGPAPVSNAEMTRAVAEALGKRVGPSLPAFAAKLMLGEIADELLLATQNVVPKKLIESGFKFNHSELAPTLSLLLKGV